jgi:hypothetical protein
MFIDVTQSPYDASGNGTTDDTAAFQQADAAGGTLYVPRGQYAIASDLTLASDIRFEQGASLLPAAGVTLTLQGWLDAGPFPVFAIPVDDTGEPSAFVYLQTVVQVVPQWFGALGNGIQDDYPAIAAALNCIRRPPAQQYGGAGAGAVLFFPPGVYLVGRPLNCTLSQYTLRGSGSFQSVLRGNTGAGNAIIDFTGSDFSLVEGLMLDTPAAVQSADPMNSSTVGVLLARTLTSAGTPGESWFVNLREVVIQIQTDAAANGGNGTVGVYNYAGEVSNMHNVFVQADTAVVYTQGNLFSLNSVHCPQDSQSNPMIDVDSSMTVCTTTGSNALVGLAGPGLRIAGAANLLIDAYLDSLATSPPANLPAPYPFAINVSGQLTDFEFRGSIEGFPCMMVNSTRISGMRFFAYGSYQVPNSDTYKDPVPPATGPAAPPSTLPVIYMQPAPSSGVGAYIQDSIISVSPTPTTLATSPTYLVDTPAQPAYVCQLYDSLIFPRNGTIRLQGDSLIEANMVLSPNKVSQVSLQAPTTGGNFVQGNDVSALSSPGVANAAPGSKPGNVVKSIQVFDAQGNSLGYVPVYDSIGT